MGAVIRSVEPEGLRLLAKRPHWRPIWSVAAALFLCLPLAANAAERAKELLTRTLALAPNACLLYTSDAATNREV